MFCLSRPTHLVLVQVSLSTEMNDLSLILLWKIAAGFDVLIGSLSNDEDDAGENSPQKVNLRGFKIHRSYSMLFNPFTARVFDGVL